MQQDPLAMPIMWTMELGANSPCKTTLKRWGLEPGRLRMESSVETCRRCSLQFNSEIDPQNRRKAEILDRYRVQVEHAIIAPALPRLR